MTLHLAAASCGRAPAQEASDLPPATEQGEELEPLRVLVFVLDDVGPDLISAYDDINGWTGDFDYPRTPWIDQFAAGGTRFDRFYASPSCSPFRASLHTGQRVTRHKLGAATGVSETFTLKDIDELFLPRAAPEVTWNHHGKWHMSAQQREPRSPTDVAGYHWSAGAMPGLGPPQWTRYYYNTTAEDGVLHTEEIGQPEGGALSFQLRVYLDALARTKQMSDEGRVFVSYVAFNFPHDLHDPESGVWVDRTDPVSGGPYHSRGTVPGNINGHPGTTPEPGVHGDWEILDVLRMQIETCDTMIGGIWSQLTPAQQARTLVLICSDNGTIGVALHPLASPSVPPHEYDISQFKARAYEGGTRTWLIAYGGEKTGVATGLVTGALSEAADLYPTILEAVGAGARIPAGIDGRSLMPLLRCEVSEVRDYAWAGNHRPNGARPSEQTLYDRCVVNRARWKLVEQAQTVDGVLVVRPRELYDLNSDPFERTDLYASTDPIAITHRQDLEAEMARIVADGEAYQR